MVVRVDGKDYVVQRPHGSKANVRLADGSNHQCKRIYRPGTHRLETDLEMQTRVQELVTELNAEQKSSAPTPATGDRPQAPQPKPSRFKRSPRWAGSSDPMPNAAPKVARAAQGYTHDPAAFPSLPQAGPGNGWQMPSKRADLCGAAVDAAAAAVLQPGIAPRAEPELARLRTATASAEVALADRLNALKPRGRIQRAVQLTKDQRRALNTEQKRQQRARDRQLVAPTQQFMAELARYDLPLVQLLMAEYALKPANAGAPGRMRLLFLEQYAATYHTKHTIYLM